MSFPQRLNELMTRDGITAYKLAQITGISDSLIGYYSKGLRGVSEKNLLKLANHFKVSADYLLDNEKSPAGAEDDVPEDFKLMARKTGELSAEQRKRIYQILNSTIDTYLEAVKGEDTDND